MLAHRICKRYSKSWTQTGSPKIKQELAGSNRNATVEELGVLHYMIRRLMRGGVGEADPGHARRRR